MAEEKHDQEKKATEEPEKIRRGSKETPKATTTKGKKTWTAWTFPKTTLEGAIRIPKAIEEKYAGNPMPTSELVKAVGFRLANDWRFLDLLRSAYLYGLVSGVGVGATIKLEKIGQDIIAPGSPHDRQKALLDAFRNVSDFKAVEDFYRGKKIPEDEFFINTLTRNFKVPKDRVQQFAEVFTANLKFLKSFDVAASESAPATTVTSETVGSTKAVTASKEPRVREFLDTCFVMMPFGEWFDKYYQEIYVPAIQEAGYEPVRADELFSTGSVVEQVWEQIVKAKILLADLTGKNPNVFYELGLAHAAKKPVVFSSANLEDVPFDLRHLRVIIYEVKDTQWAATLQRSVTDYLKNAMKDPEKSIPHPFRTTDED